jgi:hypothetical protein
VRRNYGSIDQYLAVVYSNRLETRTQDGGKTLQEFDTANDELTHGVFPARHERQVRKGTVKAFGNRIRERIVKQRFWKAREM